VEARFGAKGATAPGRWPAWAGIVASLMAGRPGTGRVGDGRSAPRPRRRSLRPPVRLRAQGRRFLRRPSRQDPALAMEQLTLGVYPEAPRRLARIPHPRVASPLILRPSSLGSSRESADGGLFSRIFRSGAMPAMGPSTPRSGCASRLGPGCGCHRRRRPRLGDRGFQREARASTHPPPTFPGAPASETAVPPAAPRWKHDACRHRQSDQQDEKHQDGFTAHSRSNARSAPRLWSAGPSRPGRPSSPSVAHDGLNAASPSSKMRVLPRSHGRGDRRSVTSASPEGSTGGPLWGERTRAGARTHRRPGPVPFAAAPAEGASAGGLI